MVLGAGGRRREGRERSCELCSTEGFVRGEGLRGTGGSSGGRLAVLKYDYDTIVIFHFFVCVCTAIISRISSKLSKVFACDLVNV